MRRLLRSACNSLVFVVLGATASALVFVGIFVMRFAFYMMHMTYGISL